MAVDWLDPCARATALRNAYYALISGDREAVIRNRGPEGERETRYAAADVTRLAAELAAAEEACMRANGQTPTPKRSAISLGARRCF